MLIVIRDIFIGDKIFFKNGSNGIITSKNENRIAFNNQPYRTIYQSDGKCGCYSQLDIIRIERKNG